MTRYRILITRSDGETTVFVRELEFVPDYVIYDDMVYDYVGRGVSYQDLLYTTAGNYISLP